MPTKTETERPAKKPEPSRLRQSYRENADRQNPNPAVQVYDSHGRPKERADHHSGIGTRRP